MNNIKHNLNRLRWNEESGTALIEFAFALPVLLTLLLGSLELNRYILIMQKVDKAAYTLADVITRTPAAYEDEDGNFDDGMIDQNTMVSFFGYFSGLMAPYTIDDASEGEGLVVVTSVYEDTDPDTDPLIKWQVMGGGTLSPELVRSDITGQPPTNGLRNTPPAFAAYIQDALEATKTIPQGSPEHGMLEKENMLAVEVFYRYVPLFAGSVFGIIDADLIIKRNAYFTPRGTGAHLNLPPLYCCESAP